MVWVEAIVQEALSFILKFEITKHISELREVYYKQKDFSNGEF